MITHLPSTRQNLSCKKTTTCPGCHRRWRVALGPRQRNWEAGGLRSPSPGKQQHKKRKSQPTSVPLTLHNMVSLREMTWSTFPPNKCPLVSLGPSSRDLSLSQRPPHVLHKITEKERTSEEQLWGRQPGVSLAGTLGLFLPERQHHITWKAFQEMRTVFMRSWILLMFWFGGKRFHCKILLWLSKEQFPKLHVKCNLRPFLCLACTSSNLTLWARGPQISHSAH